MTKKSLLAAIFSIILIFSIFVSLKFFTSPTGAYHLDVLDLRGEDEKTRLLALSLQGIVNRGSPKIYLLWESKDKFGNPSEEWLEYYKSKGWITYEYTTLSSLLKKYVSKVQGFVVYDPNFRHSINLATTMAGIYDTLIAHPDFIFELESLGLEMKQDLRGKWSDKYQAYEWQLENLFPYCNKKLIASAMPVENPLTHKAEVHMERPIRDYIIMHRAAAIDLIPLENATADYQLLHRYYKQMEPYATVLGYPFSGALERPHVELASKHGLIVVLAHISSVNFSVHSQMPARTTYNQDHATHVPLDPNKIYIAFAMSDLGLNTMQDRYYGAWDDPCRGDIPVSWWLDGIMKDFCPGIVQYYYETKTPSDFFYGAHVGGRIRPSDFPNLVDYLQRGKKYLEDCDLNTVAFSNHGKNDSYVFQTYSKILDNCIGFFYGWAPEYEYGKGGDWWIINGKVWIVTAVGAEKEVNETVNKIVSFIKETDERPLFMTVLVVLGNYPDFQFLKSVKESLDLMYPNEIEWVRGDELILAAFEYASLYH